MNASLDHRQGQWAITVTDAQGQPITGQDVQLEMVRHAFGFGCTSPSMDDGRDEERRLWLDLFDSATLPLFYWGRYEPERGKPRVAETRHTAEWLAERGVRLKGHPLVWHTVKAVWLDQLPLDEAEQLLRERIRREVREFAGLVDTFDIINEVVIMPRFTNEPDGIPNAISRICADKGRVEMVRMAVDEARSVGTNPTLHINDFDLGPEYEQLIEQLLEAGVQLDGIGLQSHMHQGFRGEEQIWQINERFARFGLPLHWTETTLVSGDLMPAEIEDLNDYVVDDWPSTPEGEQRQADEAVRHFRTLFAHPAVHGVTYWGLSDEGAWLGAPCGLVRKDMTPKPAYEALRRLVREEWWTPTQQLPTNDAGTIQAQGFAGRYRINCQGREVEVELPTGTSSLAVSL